MCIIKPFIIHTILIMGTAKTHIRIFVLRIAKMKILTQLEK